MREFELTEEQEKEFSYIYEQETGNKWIFLKEMKFNEIPLEQQSYILSIKRKED